MDQKYKKLTKLMSELPYDLQKYTLTERVLDARRTNEKKEINKVILDYFKQYAPSINLDSYEILSMRFSEDKVFENVGKYKDLKIFEEIFELIIEILINESDEEALEKDNLKIKYDDCVESLKRIDILSNMTGSATIKVPSQWKSWLISVLKQSVFHDEGFLIGKKKNKHSKKKPNKPNKPKKPKKPKKPNKPKKGRKGRKTKRLK